MILNQKSPIPLYRQLADILLAKVRSGEYPPGARIPSEHNLAGAFGIGRPTVRQATAHLVRTGILERRRGAGTFVRKTEEVDLFSLAGTTAAFREKGISVTTEIIDEIALVVVLGDSENPFFERKAWYFSRLSRVETTPILFEAIWLDPDLFHDIDRVDLSGRSLARAVEEKYFMSPVGGRQNFRIGRTGKRARHLDVPLGEPILEVKRFLHFEQRENAICSELFCRTDRFVFSQTLGGMTHG